MTRWDEREKTQSSSISNALLMIIGVFALGFVVGAIWGYMFADAEQTTPIPNAFGYNPWEEKSIQNFKITLHDGIGVSDRVILSSDTFIKP